MRITYKNPGDQGDVNISFAKTAGVADINFNDGGFDGGLFRHQETVMETKQDFRMEVSIIRNKHQWVGSKDVMHLSLILATAL